MAIAFKCPHCFRLYKVGDDLAGQAARCPCGNSFRIPAPIEEEPEEEILLPEEDEEDVEVFGDEIEVESDDEEAFDEEEADESDVFVADDDQDVIDEIEEEEIDDVDDMEDEIDEDEEIEEEEDEEPVEASKSWSGRILLLLAMGCMGAALGLAFVRVPASWSLKTLSDTPAPGWQLVLEGAAVNPMLWALYGCAGLMLVLMLLGLAGARIGLIGGLFLTLLTVGAGAAGVYGLTALTGSAMDLGAVVAIAEPGWWLFLGALGAALLGGLICSVGVFKGATVVSAPVRGGRDSQRRGSSRRTMSMDEDPDFGDDDADNDVEEEEADDDEEVNSSKETCRGRAKPKGVKSPSVAKKPGKGMRISGKAPAPRRSRRR